MIYSTVWIKIYVQKVGIRKYMSLIIFSTSFLVCNAQEIRTSRPTSPTSSPVTPTFGSSNTLQDTVAIDTNPKTNTFKTLFKGKPGKAALYSLIVPSGGQIYNRRWWKAPIALAIDGAAIYHVIQKKKEYNSFNTILDNYNNIDKYVHPEYSKEQARNFRNDRRGKVEYAWVYLTLAHLFTVFEAYVDRHLMDFDVSNDLTNSTPYLQLDQPFQPIFSVAYRFDFNKRNKQNFPLYNK